MIALEVLKIIVLACNIPNGVRSTVIARKQAVECRKELIKCYNNNFLKDSSVEKTMTKCLEE